MIELTYRPVKTHPPGWKPADAPRPYSRFDSTYSSTLSLLKRELHQLGATGAFLQVELSDPRGVRIDGGLRANAKVTHPGVILTIETRSLGTLIYSCDRFQGWGGKAGWQENLRAIALGLEALRKVERYGIAERGQQYAGFAELGSGMPMGTGERPMSLDEAAELLSSESARAYGEEWITPEMLVEGTASEVRGAFRDAAKLHHPDAGGDADLFRRLTEARDLLLGGAS